MKDNFSELFRLWEHLYDTDKKPHTVSTKFILSFKGFTVAFFLFQFSSISFLYVTNFEHMILRFDILELELFDFFCNKSPLSRLRTLLNLFWTLIKKHIVSSPKWISFYCVLVLFYFMSVCSLKKNNCGWDLDNADV